jgi:hypothetical protein
MTGHNTVTLKSGASYQGATWTDTDLAGVAERTRQAVALQQNESGVLQLILADGTALVFPVGELESIVIHVDTA